MTPDEEIGPQLQKRGLSPKDVRWVLMTHLHQDHDGGLHFFPNAEIVIDKSEWNAAIGLAGRLGGYLNQRWPKWLSPTLVDFNDGMCHAFAKSHSLTKRGDVRLIPTHGHSTGSMSVIMEEGNHAIFFVGDASYSQQLMLDQQIDGVTPNTQEAQQTLQRIRQFAQSTPTIYLPTHDPESGERLAKKLVTIFDNKDS